MNTWKRAAGLVAGALAVAVAWSGPAHATGSVVGTDKETREVGGALLTCVSFASATQIQNDVYAVVPGVGAVHGQSFYFNNQKNDMAQLLAGGWSPLAIRSRLIRENRNDPKPGAADPLLYERFGGFKGMDLLERRQYLLASLDSGTAGFTGDNNDELLGTPKARADMRAGLLADRFVGHVGGNTLTSRPAIAYMRRGFAESNEDIVTAFERILEIDIPAEQEATFRRGDLAERMFLALVGGFSYGHGDKRCTRNGVSSILGYLRVDAADGTTPINLRYSNAGNVDALTQLADMYYKCLAGTGPCVEARTAPIDT